jgi:hypothetical protein
MFFFYRYRHTFWNSIVFFFSNPLTQIIEGLEKKKLQECLPVVFIYTILWTVSYNIIIYQPGFC